MADGLLGAEEDFLSQTVLDRGSSQNPGSIPRPVSLRQTVSLRASLNVFYINSKKIQNASARLILKSSRQEHTKPLLKALHWLPISDRITFKLSCMCYNSVTASTPQYLADLLQIYTPSRTLRSTADTRKVKIALIKKKYSGQRSFSYQGPVTWNNLPFSIRHTQTYSSFKSQLKTHLFSQTFQ